MNFRNILLLASILVIAASSTSFAQTTVVSYDFNTSDEGWTNDGGNTNDWLRANVDFTTGANGNYWGFPNTGGGYANSDNATVTSPTIDLSDYYQLTFSVDIRFDIDDLFGGQYYDGFNIEYSADGGSNWNLLGAVGEGTNWYETNVVQLGEDGWSTDNGEWQTATITLPEALNANNNVQFRVNFQSDGFESFVGAAFDNLTISGQQISTQYATPSGTGVPGDASENVLLWLRPDSSLINDGTDVFAWGDFSGNNNHADAGDFPSYSSSAVNGYPAVTFNGSSNYLDLGDILDLTPGTDEWSIFGAFNIATDNTGTIISRATGAATGRQWHYFVNNNTFRNRIGGQNPASSGTATGAWTTFGSITSTSDVNTFTNGTSIISGGTIGTSTNSTNVILGARNSGAAQRLTGDIAEIIMYEGSVSSTKRRDIETYFALKYGLTLDITSQDYTVNGSSIFDNTNFNSYNSDIAGIGLDNSQSLNQTSSESASGNVLTVSNASSLDDGDFLVWGNDGGVFTSTTSNVPAGVTDRIQRIWRVSETNDVGTIDLVFDLTTMSLSSANAYSLIVSPNTASLPGDLSSGTTYVGSNSTSNGRETVTFTGVPISDQEYFTIGWTSTDPGGVSGVSLWLIADVGITESSNIVTGWDDQSGNGNNSVNEDTGGFPTLIENSINGHNTVQFNQDSLTGTAGFYTREFFVVVDPDFISSQSEDTGDILGFEIDNGGFGGLELGPATGAYDDEVITHTIGPSTSYRSSYLDGTGTVTLSNPLLINSRLDAGNDGQDIVLNGTTVSNFEWEAADHANFDDEFYRLGTDFSGDKDENAYEGTIAEVISFTSKLSDANRRDVASYLAIKYGITIDISQADPFDAYTVGGSHIYDHTSYANDIAGIGLDQSAGLFQTTSKSVNDGSFIEISSASDLDDGEFLVWGNDGGSNTFTTSDVPAGTSQRFEKIWRVAERNGDVGSVTLTFDITSLGIDKDNTTVNLLKVASGGTVPTDFATGTLITGGSFSTVDSRDFVTFTGVEFDDGEYFTIGGDIQTTAPGGVSSGLSLWMKAGESVTLVDNLVSSWANIGQSGGDATQGNAQTDHLLLPMK